MSEIARLTMGVEDKGVTLMTKVLPQLTAQTQKAEAAAARFTTAGDKGSRALSAFGSNVSQAGVSADRAARSIAGATASVQKMEGAAQKASNTIRNLAGALGIGLSLREVASLSDAYTTMATRVRLVSASEQERIATQRQLNGIADRTRASITDTTELYVKLRQANEGLGYSTRQTADLTEAFGLAVKLSGASGAGAAAAIQQFAQAMGRGTLAGDEFVTISEQAPIALQLLQQSLGVSRAKLLEMREAGLLTARVVGDALIPKLDEMRGKVGDAPKTIADGFTALQNSVIKSIGASNDMATAAKNVAEGLAGIGKFLEDNGPILLQMGKMAVLAYGGAKAFGVLRSSLVALNGISLAGLAAKLNIVGAAAALVGAGIGAGFAARGMRDAADAAERNTEVERLAALSPEERDTLAAGSVASLTAVDRRRSAIAQLTGAERSLAQEEENRLNARRNQIIKQQQMLRDAGAFAGVIAESSTGKPPRPTASAADIKKAREKMLAGLAAAGKQITDDIAAREFRGSVMINSTGPLRTQPVDRTGIDAIIAERTKAAKASEDAAEAAARRIEQTMQALANSVQRTLSDGVFGVITKGMKSIEDFFAQLKTTILRTFADIVASAATKKLLEVLAKVAVGAKGGAGGGATAGGATGFAMRAFSLAAAAGSLGKTAGAQFPLQKNAVDPSRPPTALDGLRTLMGKKIPGLGAKDTIGGGLLAAGGGFALGNFIGQKTGKAGGFLGGAATGAALGTFIPGIGNATGAVIGGLAGAIGGLFGGSKKKQKEREAARKLAEDAAAFSSELIIRTMEASGDSLGADRKRLELTQKAELEAAAQRFGKNSPQYRALQATQAKEREAQQRDAADSDMPSGVYQAPAGFDINAYRFAAGGSGKQQQASQGVVVTGNDITIAVPQGTTTQQAEQIVRELTQLASRQGVSRWSDTYV